MSNSLDDQQQWLALAERAALSAGEALRRRSAAWTEVTEARGRDVKVAADRMAEGIILPILESGPPFAILSEERGWSGAENDRAWIVDPLDGSANYARGIPLSAVSIALVDGRDPILGVVYDFSADELYAGIVGDGCRRNGQAIEVSAVDRMDAGILMTGLPARRDVSPPSMADLASELARWRKVRMIGSAALAVAYVAAGRADAYREEGTMFWDVAAGCALVRAAGGHVAMSDGPRNEAMTVVAHNGRLHDLTL